MGKNEWCGIWDGVQGGCPEKNDISASFWGSSEGEESRQSVPGHSLQRNMEPWGSWVSMAQCGWKLGLLLVGEEQMTVGDERSMRSQSNHKWHTWPLGEPPKAEVGKVWPLGQTQSSACFCKQFYWNTTNLCLCTFYGSFWDIVTGTEITQPTKPKIFSYLTLLAKFPDPWLKDLSYSFGFL